MKRILVTYATMAGSTVEVAQAVGEEISKSGLQVDVLPMEEITGLEAYDGVVVGGPMIMGWHRTALGFLKRQRRSLQHRPFAIFVTAMRLTQMGDMGTGDTLVYVDEDLPKPPKDDARPNFSERYARLASYLRPILKATRPAKPASIGVFGGRLEYGRLRWWAVLFVTLIVRAPAGDRRNWTAIRSWAAGLPAVLQVEEAATAAPKEAS